jgi:hypothetical protein
LNLKAGIRVSTALAIVVGGLLLVPAGAGAAPTGSIEGVVTDASSHSPIEEALVCPFEAQGELAKECAETGPLGEYTISGLPSGSYKVGFFADFEGLNYVTQFYDDKSSFEAAEPVTVGTGATTGIDAEMVEGAQITGRVTDAVSAAPIGAVLVCVEAADEEFGECIETDPTGEYVFSGLPSGSYKVEFWAPYLNYVTQFYDGKASFGEATEISVVAGSIKSNVNAAMVKVTKTAPPHVMPIVPPVSLPIHIFPTVAKPKLKPLKCAKGQVKKKVGGKPKCVKVKHHKKHKKGHAHG